MHATSSSIPPLPGIPLPRSFVTEHTPKSCLLWDFMLQDESKRHPKTAMLIWLNNHEDPEHAKVQVLSFSWTAWMWAGGDVFLGPDAIEWAIIVNAAIRRPHYRAALEIAWDDSVPYKFWSPSGTQLPELPVSQSQQRVGWIAVPASPSC